MKKYIILGLVTILTTSLKSQWSDLGDLNIRRSSTQAVSKDNKVYVIGGYERASGTSLTFVTSSMDIIDEQSGQVSIVTLPNGANRFSAIAAGDKGIYMFSGGNWGGLTKRCYRYANDTFVEIDTIPEAITLFTTVKVGSRIILGGGNFGHLGSFSNRIYIYDENTEEWSVDSLSVARQYYGMVTDGNKVYFAGGWDNDSTDHVTNLIDIWDVANDTWTTDTLSVPRAAVCGGFLNGKIFFAGGWYSGTNNSSNVVDIYNGSSWSTNTLSVSRGAIKSASLGDELIFVGGGDFDEQTLDFSQSYNAFDVYNDLTNMITSGQTNYSHFEGGIAATDNNVYAAGGLIQEAGVFVDYAKEIEVYRNYTGFKEDSSTPQKIVFPNPSKGVFTISGLSEDVDFHVYDVLGHELRNGKLSKYKPQIDLSSLPKGMYYLLMEGQTEMLLID